MTAKLSEKSRLELEGEIKKRYGPELFYLYGASKSHVFSFGLFRLLAAAVYWLLGAFSFSKRPQARSHLAPYTTQNQHLALEALKRSECPEIYIFRLYALGFGYSIGMASLLLLSALWYPFRFCVDQHVPSLHDRLFLRQRISLLLKAMVDLQSVSLTVSNDHQGEVFWMSFIWGKDGNQVKYVQHGAVKSAFPINYFSQCYVRDDETALIYRTYLCQKKNVEIFVVKELNSNLIGIDDIEKNNILIAISDQFHLWETRRLVRFLRKACPSGTQIRLRFHPSDRLARVKYFLTHIGFRNVSLDPVRRPFRHSFMASQCTISALSSVLMEAAQADPKRVIWLKSLGDIWDYYELEGKIEAYQNVADLRAHFEQSIVSSRA